eukprot:gene22339-biopygen7933
MVPVPGATLARQWSPQEAPIIYASFGGRAIPYCRKGVTAFKIVSHVVKQCYKTLGTFGFVPLGLQGLITIEGAPQELSVMKSNASKSRKHATHLMASPIKTSTSWLDEAQSRLVPVPNHDQLTTLRYCSQAALPARFRSQTAFSRVNCVPSKVPPNTSTAHWVYWFCFVVSSMDMYRSAPAVVTEN